MPNMADIRNESRSPSDADAGEAIVCCGGDAADAEDAGTLADGGRRAIGADPAIKAGNLRRLRRIEGQVRGLQRMVDEERYCTDILTQISSVHEALRATGRELMRSHLRHCVAAAVHSGPEAAEAAYDELVELMYRHAR